MTDQPNTVPNRLDIYGPAHKCIRHAHFTQLTELGKADFSRPQSELLAALRFHLRMIAQHLAEEDMFIHPVLETRAPGGTSRTKTQHKEHHAYFHRLEELIQACEDNAGSIAAGRQLYLSFGQFVGLDLGHMDEEEQATQPLLWQCLSDEELGGIFQQIVQSYSQEALLFFLPHLAAAGNMAELTETLTGLRAALPADAYAELTAAMVPAFGTERLAALREQGLIPTTAAA